MPGSLCCLGSAFNVVNQVLRGGGARVGISMQGQWQTPLTPRRPSQHTHRDKLHDQLVLRNRLSTIKSLVTEAKSVSQASAAQLSSMADNVRVALGARE